MQRQRRMWRRIIALAICTVILAAFGTNFTFAQDVTTPTMDDIAAVKTSIDTTWVFLTGFLVFFMQTGFALLETGLIRQTGAVNALLENFIDAGLTALVWWAVGFGIAFGADNGSGLFGTSYFFISAAQMSELYPGLTINLLTMFFFQFAFAATASTITTGAMAERTDFIGDLIYSALIAIRPDRHLHLPCDCALGLGQRLALPAGFPRLRWQHRCTHRRWCAGAGRCLDARPA